MRITTKGRYALRAVLALAQMGKNGEMVSINSLSEAEDISSVFLEQIFFKLRKAGIVTSIRGPKGGFSFARPPESISVKEILHFAGEEMEVLPCDRHFNDCERISECICHKVLTSVTDMVNKYLGDITLQMLLVDEEFQPEKKYRPPVQTEETDKQLISGSR